MIRVGMGYDVHKLVENRDLWMGGIRIDYEKGLPSIVTGKHTSKSIIVKLAATMGVPRG